MYQILKKQMIDLIQRIIIVITKLSIFIYSILKLLEQLEHPDNTLPTKHLMFPTSQRCRLGLYLYICDRHITCYKIMIFIYNTQLYYSYISIITIL
jgi:hypothetical protein